MIFGAARLCGLLLRRLGQPAVIGERAASLLLGPIVLGAWWPQAHAAAFAKPGPGALSGLSRTGVVPVMFVDGAELRASEGTRTRVHSAFSVGLPGIALPIAGRRGLLPFASSIAATMSLTAFPVPARTLKHRGTPRATAVRLATSAAHRRDSHAAWRWSG